MPIRCADSLTTTARRFHACVTPVRPAASRAQAITPVETPQELTMTELSVHTEPRRAPGARLPLTQNIAPTQAAGRSVAGSAGSVSSCVERGMSASNRKGFGNFLEALHDSRRRQAAREIHRYQQLVREAREYDARPRPESQRSRHGGGQAMSANLSSHSSSTDHLPKPQSSMSFKLRILMAAALVGFGILHLIGGATMQRASKPPTEAAMLAHTGD
jgi:hypothetical protein